MARERTQLNINIDPELLVKLKSEAIKNGKTLTEFVVEQLTNSPGQAPKEDGLEKRLLRIERYLKLDKNSSDHNHKIGTIFTDHGARCYGKVAKELFESHGKSHRISIENGLQELSVYLEKHEHSNPELVFQILLGSHDLTGLEMTKAYRNGSCAMRTALVEWSNDNLEDLNKAFLDAVITKSLA